VELNHLYGSLKKCFRPLRLFLGGVRAEFREELERAVGLEMWKVIVDENDALEMFRWADGDAEEEEAATPCVYLSPDSDVVLTSVAAPDVYVIGGICDHNRLKNMSLTKARTGNVRHARLPIHEALGLKLSNSLNINHVFDILQAQAYFQQWCACEVCGDRRKALATALLPRHVCSKSEKNIRGLMESTLLEEDRSSRPPPFFGTTISAELNRVAEPRKVCDQWRRSLACVLPRRMFRDDKEWEKILAIREEVRVIDFPHL
jgi:hypothetical protein